MVGSTRQLRHSSHQHSLNWTTRIETSYQCDGCQEEGFHSCYQCNENGCDFHLHKQCSVGDDFQYSTNHGFFSNTCFIFYTKPLQQVLLCVACGKHVKGSRYSSMCNKYVIHPCCFELQTVLQGDVRLGPDLVQVNLSLVEKAKKRWLKKCQICRKRKISEDIYGWVYVTDSHNFYHVRCIQDHVLAEWKKRDQPQYNPSGDLGRHILRMTIGHNLPLRQDRNRVWEVLKEALRLVITAVLGGATSELINLIL